MAKYFHSKEPLLLEGGEVLSELTIAYDTYGERNADDSNIIWVCHALTASSDVESWWPEMIGDSITVVTHPASTTHKQLSDEAKVKAGIAPTLLRISAGLEAVEDIIEDFEQAFAQI